MKEIRLTAAGRDASGGLFALVFTAALVAGALWLATQTTPGADVTGDLLDSVTGVGRGVADTLASFGRR